MKAKETVESQEDQTRFVMAKLLWIKQTKPATKLAEAIVHFLRDLKDGVTNNCTHVEPPRRSSDCRGCQEYSFKGRQCTEQETMKYKALAEDV